MWDRCDALGRLSELPGGLTRVFLSPQQRDANRLVLAWMEEAGMRAHVDAIGNCVGRYEGASPGLPCLMLGSHLDTVRDAGKYDGMLGVVSAIECVAALHATGTRLPFAIEVVGFGDEEGVRYGSTLLGSRAVAGTFDRALLDEGRRGRHRRCADALAAFGLDPRAIATVARQPGQVHAYAELHIEQGPVLESIDLPVGVVTAINGGNRFDVEVTGVAGHAGTVPMGLRRDALAAAAECVLAAERIAAALPDVVATVGRIEALPGAMNVIPGKARFSLDVRAPTDAKRHAAAVEAIQREFAAIAQRRAVDLSVALAVGGEDRAVRAGHAAPVRGGDPRRRRARASPAVGRGPRRHGDHRHRADRHAVRALRRRHQPQSRRGGDAGRRRHGHARARAVHPELRAPDPELTLADAYTTIHDFLAAHRAERGGASSPSSCACRPTIRPAIARRTPRARRQLLEAMGFAVERHAVPADRVRANGMVSCTNLVVRVRFGSGAGPVIALNAHGDVVPPGLNWTADPYGAEVRDGFMYGRGVAVSKSDFATYAFALRALQAAAAAGARLDGTVELHFTYDEEAGGAIGPALPARAEDQRARLRDLRRASRTASRPRTTAACTSRWRSSASRGTRRSPRRASTRWKRRRASWPTSTRCASRTRPSARRSPASRRRRSSSASSRAASTPTSCPTT